MTPLILGWAVGGAVSVEVGRDRRLPLFNSPAEAGDLQDQAGREGTGHLGPELSAPFRSGVVDVAELLVTLPGQRDFVAVVPSCEVRIEACGLFLGEVFGADLQGSADAVERIALASPTPQHGLLDAAAADVVDHG